MEMLVNPIALKEINSADNPFQSEFWAKVKGLNRWVSYGFTVIPEAGEDTDAISEQTMLVLVKKFPGSFSLAYIPFAPTSVNGILSGKLLYTIAGYVVSYINESVFAVRFDLPWNHSVTEWEKSDTPPPPPPYQLSHLSYSIQPEYTVVIDLTRPIDEIYQSFRKRAKRNIQKCRELTIKKIKISEEMNLFNKWYETYIITAERDGFQPRSADYIRELLILGSTEEQSAVLTESAVSAKLYLAILNNEIIAGIVTIQSKNRSVFLLGSSLRNTGIDCSPSYLLQWEAIQDAKETGCSIYDLFGIPPPDSRNHHLKGLSTFKSSFGGDSIRRSGTWDIPVQRIPYFIYSVIEKKRIKRARSL